MHELGLLEALRSANRTTDRLYFISVINAAVPGMSFGALPCDFLIRPRDEVSGQ